MLMKEKYKVAPDCIDAKIRTTKQAINSDDEKRINPENTGCKWIIVDNRIKSCSKSSSANIRKVGYCGCVMSNPNPSPRCTRACLLADDWKTRSRVTVATSQVWPKAVSVTYKRRCCGCSRCLFPSLSFSLRNCEQRHNCVNMSSHISQ